MKYYWPALMIFFGILIPGLAAPDVHAAPGECLNTPWGGYCDGPLYGGTFQHCEGAMGFSRCFLVRPVPVSVDPRGWVPA